MTGAAERRRRARIAHVLPFPGVGGTEHATLRLMQALRSRGVQGTVLCLQGADEVAALFAGQGFAVRRWLPRPTHRGRLELLRATLATAWTLWRTRVDAVHLADLGAALPQVVGAARWLRKPVVCHVRNHVERLSPAILSQLPHVRRFVFVSRRTWDTCIHAVPEERGIVLYDGVEAAPEHEVLAGRAKTAAAVRRELGLPPEAELVVMVARVEPQKDFATLARTAARVVAERPSAHFVVVGGFDRTPAQREHWPQVRQWMDAAGVAAHVHFVGFRDDVRRLLTAADVMLLVTHHEGLPLVLFEAMATATPIVATAVDGVPEAVRDGENGHLVARADDADAAARVLGLLADRERARRLGRGGRDWLQHTFSVDRFADAARAVYDDLVPARGTALRWRLLLAGLTALLTYLALEIGYRVVRHHQLASGSAASELWVLDQPLWTTDEATGFRYRPDVRATLRHFAADGSLVRSNRIETDAAGHPGGGGEIASADASLWRVAVLGDSFAAGIDQDVPWPSRLQARLRADAALLQRMGKRDAIVVNLGLDGIGLEQMAAVAQRELPRLHPDLVLVDFIADDIARRFVWRALARLDAAPDAHVLLISPSLPVSLDNPECAFGRMLVLPPGTIVDATLLRRLLGEVARAQVARLPWLTPQPTLLAELLGPRSGLRSPFARGGTRGTRIPRRQSLRPRMPWRRSTRCPRSSSCCTTRAGRNCSTASAGPRPTCSRRAAHCRSRTWRNACRRRIPDSAARGSCCRTTAITATPATRSTRPPCTTCCANARWADARADRAPERGRTAGDGSPPSAGGRARYGSPR